jgi:uncharacterized membrane protein YjfL (UPF0719 family)
VERETRQVYLLVAAGKWYTVDNDYLVASLTNLVVNLVYAVVALVVAVLAVRSIDRYLYRALDFEEEIKRGNIAAAIFASVLLIFVALLVFAAMSK